ncbi:MAG: NUDIX hydrolase [Pseudomonadota bacterium]
MEARPIPAVGCICLKGDEVLLVQRGHPPQAGEWSIPGGCIELGEAAKEAALRELREETGVEADVITLVDVVDAVFERPTDKKPDFHYVLIDYVARWVSGEPVAGDDAVDARFVKLSDLDNLGLWDETRRVILKGYDLMQLVKHTGNA